MSFDTVVNGATIATAADHPTVDNMGRTPGIIRAPSPLAVSAQAY
nr:hypothetical protein [Marinicella sp. W31]MDC2879573.1 hypothetical protein [Marinicella sp. W31]